MTCVRRGFLSPRYTVSSVSSKSVTGETGVSDGGVARIDLGSVPTERSRQFDVERRLLCERIEALERELIRERRRRDQIVAHYERLLEAERRGGERRGADQQGAERRGGKRREAGRQEEEGGFGDWLRGLF